MSLSLSAFVQADGSILPAVSATLHADCAALPAGHFPHFAARVPQTPAAGAAAVVTVAVGAAAPPAPHFDLMSLSLSAFVHALGSALPAVSAPRSDEHTSELQSRL